MAGRRSVDGKHDTIYWFRSIRISSMFGPGKKMVYTWITPRPTQHMFRATPKNKDAHVTVKVTDRFGKEYIQTINP